MNILCFLLSYSFSAELPSGLYFDILLNSGAENRPHHSSLLEVSSTLYVTYTVLSFKIHLLKKRDALESYENLKTGFPLTVGLIFSSQPACWGWLARSL